MAGIKNISFRGQLKGEVGDFIEKSGMACVETIQALTELIVELSHYEEEGKPLFPKVLICDSLPEVLGSLLGSSPIVIGAGPKLASTVKQALKKCAPLAQQEWSIFIERTGSGFSYGVFREPELPTSLDIRATLASLPEGSVRAVLACQMAERAVEIVGTADRHLHIHLSAVSTDESPVNASTVALIDAAICGVDEKSYESVRSYFLSTIGHALLHGHGALIAVLDKDQPLPPLFANDGVLLPEPIELAIMVENFLTAQSVEAVLALRSYSALLEGMLGCDGITVLRSGGSIVGYNYFVKETASVDTPASELIGGARRRAFAALGRAVDEGSVYCAFIRSSNGTSEHKIKVGA